MKNLRKNAGRTSTGIHMLQRSGRFYRFRCYRATLKRFTSVDVKPEFRHLFGEKGESVYLSDPFDSVEEGASELCRFVEKVCGVQCTYSE
ncbi:hypothetical protein R2X23_03175 [Citrobacter braakii]|uniref:hypothetical protein n=1 Tax=Citrobacter braakii TaxID=57706 RepID=UPI0024E094C1|nr:hypothetical protein [Citrobacter braakii]WOR25719.1 hypothetical protein R2X23_03175 [Citrobacter braakii]